MNNPGKCIFAKSQILIIFSILLAQLVTGCARHQVSDAGAIPIKHIERSDYELEKFYWWHARFKIAWPDESPPDGAVDLFLADAVIRPVLEEYTSQLYRWRFHRRAGRDSAGHQFSFIFYSSPDVAAAIFEKIKGSAVLRRVMSAHMIEKMMLDDPVVLSKSALGDTSDSHWPPSLQKHWPAYIMGVSALWLGLIDEYKDKTVRDRELDVQALIDTYRETEERITHIWYEQGQHALLHHLNAVFGYEPILIKKEIRF